MKKVVMSALASAIVLGSISTASAEENGIEILDGLKFKGEIRPRYESANVDVTNGTDKKAANAFTNRLALAIEADKLFGSSMFGAYLEGTMVNNFGYDNYNSTQNGKTQYDVVADPQQARLTQAYLDFNYGGTLLRGGRQAVNLDNQRFVGTVNWRQMPQTFDAATVVNTSVKDLTLIGAYVFGVNRITAQNNITGATEGSNEAYDTNSVILNASYKVADELKITGYGYLLSSINSTYGASLTGKAKFGDVKLNYRGEYAKQDDAVLERHSANDLPGSATPTAGAVRGEPKADAYYYNLDVGANIYGVLAGANYEFLSGTNGTDNKTAFSTPLATLHKFNGWADVFLATPTGGLRDANVKLGYATKSFGKFAVIYHKFDSEYAMANIAGTGTSKDLGSEIDAVYTRAIPGVNNLKGLIKYAKFNGGDVAATKNDVQKVWVQLDYKFSIN
ncbi:MAG: alginate export family protein [Campylobacterota bacterium]|nr:alginate export family protein [Campylobacterota bacterium]